MVTDYSVAKALACRGFELVIVGLGLGGLGLVGLGH
jgi:hypothetical protein